MATRTSQIILKKPIIYNETLNNTDWKTITLSSTKNKIIMVQCRTSVEIFISFIKTQNTYWSIKSGGNFIIDTTLSNIDSDEDLKFWIKTESPTVIAEIVVGE